MYEALQKVSADLQILSERLSVTALDQARIAALSAAFATTAEEMEQAARVSQTPDERADLAKLYHGMLAAKRILEHLAEQECAA